MSSWHPFLAPSIIVTLATQLIRSENNQRVLHSLIAIASGTTNTYHCPHIRCRDPSGSVLVQCDHFYDILWINTHSIASLCLRYNGHKSKFAGCMIHRHNPIRYCSESGTGTMKQARLTCQLTPIRQRHLPVSAA
jgi:hypothetical protein